jgi:hypothetical protein
MSNVERVDVESQGGTLPLFYYYRWSHRLPLKFIGVGWDSVTKLPAASWQLPTRLQVSNRGVLPPTKPISEQP